MLQIRSIVLPIYYNNSEEVEARIAAFLVYIQCAIDIPSPEFLHLVKSLKEEPNLHVKTFVYTYLSEIETHDSPLMTRGLVSFRQQLDDLY